MSIGTYIGPPDRATDLAVEHAVTICLESGRINALDTAINYRHQRAERSVGRAIGNAVTAHVIDRDEVFVATKSGYLAPDAESGLTADQWVETELFRRKVLDPTDVIDGCHAMSVPYLTDQFERSCANLGLTALDLVYLHNAPDAQLPTVGRSEFRKRLRAAFELYERYRREGRLGAYGIATWESLRVPRSSPNHLDLESAVEVAEEVGGPDHGFRFLQFPFNLAMPEAAELRNQPVRRERLTLFEAARKLKVGCFTSVPLFQGQLARNGPSEDGLSAAQTAIQFARSALGTLGPIIGQKRPEHLAENLAVGGWIPWDEPRFRRMLT